MSTTNVLTLAGLTLAAAGVVLFRRWNRELERAVALPAYRHPSVAGSLHKGHVETPETPGFPASARYLKPSAFERSASLPAGVRRALS